MVSDGSKDSIATDRPGAVIIAVGIMGFLAIASVIVALLSLIAPGVFPPHIERFPLAPERALAYLAAGLVGAVAVYFAAKGFGVARWPLAVLCALSVMNAVASGTVPTGTFVFALAVVMLFLTESNAWFSAKRAERAAAV